MVEDQNWLHCLTIVDNDEERNGVVIKRVRSIVKELRTILKRRAKNTTLDTRSLRSCWDDVCIWMVYRRHPVQKYCIVLLSNIYIRHLIRIFLLCVSDWFFYILISNIIIISKYYCLFVFSEKRATTKEKGKRFVVLWEDLIAFSYSNTVMENSFNNEKLFLLVKPGLRLETWKNIRGNRLSNLQANDRFPNKPDEVTTVKIFDIGKDRMDNYGARVSGYFRVCKLDIQLIVFIRSFF